MGHHFMNGKCIECGVRNDNDNQYFNLWCKGYSRGLGARSNESPIQEDLGKRDNSKKVEKIFNSKFVQDSSKPAKHRELLRELKNKANEIIDKINSLEKEITEPKPKRYRLKENLTEEQYNFWVADSHLFKELFEEV